MKMQLKDQKILEFWQINYFMRIRVGDICRAFPFSTLDYIVKNKIYPHVFVFVSRCVRLSKQVNFCLTSFLADKNLFNP